jgi:hypothetical protein
MDLMFNAFIKSSFEASGLLAGGFSFEVYKSIQRQALSISNTTLTGSITTLASR